RKGPARATLWSMSRRPTVVLDGPMGTELARRGVALPAPAWSAVALDVAPDLVAAVHRDYLAAGATVHTANTFRTKRRSVGPRWEELARRAVAIARAAVGGFAVAGSIAPLEDCYRADLSPGAASREEHRELARVLADAGVDLLLCETFPDATEAVVAVEEAARTGVETWAALLPATPGRLREAARACVAAGARAVLVNCVAAKDTLPFVEALVDVGVPFGAYANAGPPGDALGWDADPDAAARAYEALARRWLDAGVSILGGCCGTGPAHVARVAAIQ
ncbi:MAG TPA: homocysteine S-methyltransferase family protein, partial [Polyangiaceae bacterium]|nr:homocysteine S-methyltransferase family protein [Polyangiaceae bacterium]